MKSKFSPTKAKTNLSHLLFDFLIENDKQMKLFNLDLICWDFFFFYIFKICSRSEEEKNYKQNQNQCEFICEFKELLLPIFLLLHSPVLPTKV